MVDVDQAKLQEAVDAVPVEDDGTAGTTEEKEPEPDVWTKQSNRRERRDAYNLRGAVQASRSRIRRRVNRISRQKGDWQ